MPANRANGREIRGVQGLRRGGWRGVVGEREGSAEVVMGKGVGWGAEGVNGEEGMGKSGGVYDRADRTIVAEAIYQCYSLFAGQLCVVVHFIYKI